MIAPAEQFRDAIAASPQEFTATQRERRGAIP